MATAIEFDHVGKQYRLGLVSTRTLSHDLDRWWQTSVLKKEDPYLKIGETNFREWYRYSVSAAYEDDSPLPWTRLGYTYDWHHGANRQGLSEYVVVDQTYLKVKSYESEWQFIQNLSK